MEFVRNRNPSDELERVLEAGLVAHNADAGLPDRDVVPLSISYRGESSEIKAGLLGRTLWGWLHVKLLWVDNSLRGQGVGARLMQEAEAEAQARGCKMALVDTFSFQAPEFYEKLGYQRFGVLEGFPPGHSKIYFKKELT